MRNVFLIFTFFSFCTVSCNLFRSATDDPADLEAFLESEGVFIVNEGNYLSGNGSVSYYSFDSLYIYNDIFSRVNDRPLGDIPNQMVISGNKAWIVVNNSGKVEIADLSTMRSETTIRDLSSPRQMLAVSSEKAYISSLSSNLIAIIDLKDGTVSGHINIRRTSEQMVMSGDKVYVASWASGREIVVIDCVNDIMIDSLEVGSEPESMVLDKNNKLWVLCSGSYTGQYFPELIRVNISGNKIDRRLVFPSSSVYPSALRINATGDTLYYIENGIWRMGIGDAFLPSEPFIRPSGRYFYKIGIDNSTGILFATNVIDFQQKGYLLWFDGQGTAIDSVRTDIIPGALCFKRKQN